MKANISATRIVLIAVSLTGAAPPPVEHLKPASAWNIHYDDESCKLRRTFGEGDESVSIELSRFSPSDHFQIIFYGKRLAAIDKAKRVAITFGDFLAQEKDQFSFGQDTSGVMALIISGISILPVEFPKPDEPFSAKITPAQESAARTVTISSKTTGTQMLETGSFGAPLAQMRRCIDDLVRGWGIDPGLQLRSRPIPKQSQGNWITDSDYPLTALQAGRQAVVSYRLNVDANGVPIDCRIQTRYGPADFAQKTCDLLKQRAQFKPALDSNGQPVSYYFLGRVRWSML